MPVFDIQTVQWYSFVVATTLALVLLLIKVPRTEYARKLTQAKNAIAVSYMIGAFVFLYTLYYNDVQEYERFSALTMLIVVTFSSISLSYSLINLILPKYIDSSRFMLSMFIVFAASFILIESFFSENDRLHTITLIIGLVLFAIQSSYLIITFDKAYKSSLELLEKYYDEDEEHKIKWIRFCYILTMLTDMFILVYIFLPHGLIRIYMFFYILYMIYFASNFISFLGSHKLMLDALGHSAFSDQRHKPKKAKKDKGEEKDEFSGIEAAINKWIEEKRYRESDLSKEEIAHEIGTSKEMLQLYFADRVGEDFRSWRTGLRVEDAKKMLLEKKDRSINYIGEITGFSDRSNFHRQFTKIVGCSPKVWRETDGHPEQKNSKIF